MRRLLAAQSPWVRALRGALGNRMAVCGGTVVLVMSSAVLLAPWLTPHDPAALQPWVQAQPPGYRHPQVLGETRLAVGQQAGVPASQLDCRQLRYEVRVDRRERYRVQLRRGRIHRITRERGAEPLDRLSLDPKAHAIAEERADGTLRSLDIGAAVLVRDEPPPPGLLAGGQRVLLLTLSELEAPTSRIDAQLADGRITALTIDGQPATETVIRAPGVRAVYADGKLRQSRHLLGTDAAGRDLLARVLYGGRISLLIGLAATAVSLLIGVLVGALAGYVGGAVDRLLMGVVDILYAVPFMFLVIVLLVLFGRSLMMLFIALGAVQWLTMARIVRGQVLSLRESPFVDAARATGAPGWWIIWRHIIPNTMGPVIIYTTLTIPAVILEESFLAFLGLTVQYNNQNLDSWGSLVHAGMQALGQNGESSWLLVWPAAAMVSTLLGLNFLGDGLRDILDPKTARKRR